MKSEGKTETAGEPVRDLEFWKGDALRAREERDRAKERLRALEAEAADLRARETERARTDARTKDEAERGQLEREGKYREALEAAGRKHAAELTALREAARRRLLPAAILAAARQVPALAPDALSDLPELLRPRVRLNDETLDVEPLGEDGKPLTDEHARPVALDQFVATFVQARPYLLLDRMQPGTGTAPGAGQGGAAELSMEAALRDGQVAAAWRARDPEGYRRACAEYLSPHRVKERARAKFTT
jgi:hypothetical protein